MKSIALAIIAVAGPVWAGPELKGAESILLDFSRAMAETNTAQIGGATALQADIKAYGATAATLTAKDAAEQWLVLLDRFWTLVPTEIYGVVDEASGVPLSLRTLLAALPPETAWDELAAQVEGRIPAKDAEKMRETLLRLLAHVLVNNQEGEYKDVASLAKLASDSDNRDWINGQLQQIVLKLNLLTGNKTGVKESFELALSLRDDSTVGTVEVPDLVTLLGKPEAEKLIRKALRSSNSMLQVLLGRDTLALAQQLALELVDESKAPQWQLVASFDALELYEALDRKYPAAAPTDEPPDEDEDSTGLGFDMSALARFGASAKDIEAIMRQSHMDPQARERLQAKIYYMLGLIAHGRASQAKDVAVTMADTKGDVYFPDEAVVAMDKAGYTEELRAFLHELLSEKPDLPFWEKYIDLSTRAGQTDDMMKLVRANAANPDVSPLRRRQLDLQLAHALLAVDQPEEAVELLRRLAQAADDDGVSDTMEVAVQLVSLGFLLKQDAWVEDGLRSARAFAEKEKVKDPTGYSASYALTSLAAILRKIGRDVEAEAVLTQALVDKARATKKSDNQMYRSGDEYNSEMGGLVRLYYDHGRLDDVRKLVDEFPHWGVKDLADIQPDYSGWYGGHGNVEVPVNLALAGALHAAGRDAEALPILRSLLETMGGYDPAYEMYISIEGTNALALMDSLYALDRYEERPLVWKAHILRASGRLDDAEKCARAAIAVDPSDGEQGKGMRMRVYAELAEILEAKGDKENAAFFREVVKSIRISEAADDFYEAGLLSRGIAMYREALAHFSDAYCIQSRLAVQLEQMGRYAEAEKHYQRAYELMPESFGRVESHCFGCEGVFDSDRARDIAERVFASLAEKMPDKPQVHYLLGYLRNRQGRYPEALEGFRKAVQLDPEYLNAWREIGGLGDKMQLLAEDRDAVAMKQLQLDPQMRHGGANFRGVLDLKKLWQALALARQQAPARAAAVYPLAASRAYLEEQDKKMKDAFGSNPMTRYSYRVTRNNGTDLDPASVLQSHEIIGPVVSLLETSSSFMMED